MRLVLYPLSVIYKIITSLRNLLFDYRILESRTHSIPVICIGNLSIGGTGKTPHTSYIAKLLSKKHKIAILSRGYGRKSSNFNYVESDSTTSSVGDEPLQLKFNNSNCIVAVSNNRNIGIEKILIDHPEIDLILLDDGFQHRKIRAGLNIIITPFKKPFIKNDLLPLGTLREASSGAKRADIILISKTPKEIDSKRKKEVLESLNIEKHQKGYFSSITYHKYKNIRTDAELDNEEEYSITLVCAIADPNPLVQYLKKKEQKVNVIKFRDHYNYTKKDIDNILLIYNKDKSTKKLILTTEKDATKLRELLTNFKKEDVYYIPIEITINDNKIFEEQLSDYVKRN